MNDNYLKIYLSLFLMLLSKLLNFTCQGAMVSTFYGDISFRQFLAKFCSRPPLKTKLIFISAFKFDSEEALTGLSESYPKSTFQYREMFQQNHNNCLYFSRISAELLINTFLNTDLSIRHHKIHIVFDFSQRVRINSSTFNFILTSLAPLFTTCRKCLPFMLLFKLPPAQLLKRSQELFSLLPITFRAVLVDVSSSTASSSSFSSVVFIRPVIHGCELLNSVFVPQNSSDYRKLKTTECNLNQKVLKVSVNNDFPYCSYTVGADDGQTVIPEYSIEFELLKVIEKTINFTGQLVDAKNAWGMKVNGSWNGLIKQVFTGVSDFGMCELSRNRERAEVVQHTAYTFIEQVVFVSRSPGAKRESGLHLFSSKISLHVWLCELASVVLILLIFFVITFNQKRGIRRREPNEKSTFLGKLRQTEAVLFKLTSIYFRQSMKHTSFEPAVPSSAPRLLYGSWMLASLILVNAYASVFYSTLTVTEYGRPVDTVEDLLTAASSDSHYILTKDRSATMASIVNARPNDTLNYALQQHMNRVRQQQMMFVQDMVPMLERQPKNVIITLKVSALVKRYLQAQVPLHVGSEPLETIYLGWAFRKKDPLVPYFNVIIIRLREMGIFEHWLEAAVLLKARETFMINRRERLYSNLWGNLYTSRQMKEDPNSLSKLSLRSLVFLFQTLLYALFICSVCFTVECLLSFVVNKKNRLMF